MTVRFGGLTALDDVSLDGRPRRGGRRDRAQRRRQDDALQRHLRLRARRRGHRPLGRTRRWTASARISSGACGIARTLQGVGLFARADRAGERDGRRASAIARAGRAPRCSALPRSDRAERALRERALAALDELGVADAADRLPGQPAYGVQKRVALARALVARPRLLLLDEPAGGLGADDMAELGERSARLRETTAVVLVEHHMDLVMAVCDRVVVLDFGRCIADGHAGRGPGRPARARRLPRGARSMLRG